MAMELLDLPFTDKAIQIIRGTKAWVETLRNELRMKRRMLNLLAQKQLRQEKGRRPGGRGSRSISLIMGSRESEGLCANMARSQHCNKSNGNVRWESNERDRLAGCGQSTRMRKRLRGKRGSGFERTQLTRSLMRNSRLRSGKTGSRSA